jgi:hypothetical protein
MATHQSVSTQQEEEEPMIMPPRRRYRPRFDWLSFITQTIVMLIFDLYKAWALMIAIGIAHAELGLPRTAGYWTAFILMILISIITTNFMDDVDV